MLAPQRAWAEASSRRSRLGPGRAPGPFTVTMPWKDSASQAKRFQGSRGSERPSRIDQRAGRNGVEAVLDADYSRPRRTERIQRRYGSYEGTINAFINAAALSLSLFGSRCTLSMTASPRVNVMMTSAA